VAETIAVVTNYLRPSNTVEICNRLLRQDCDVVIVDNSPGPSLELLGMVPNGVTDVWRWHQNSGPACRFAPVWMMSQNYRYAWFIDDDLMPGEKALESLLMLAGTLEDKFATIGQIGRIFKRKRRRRYQYVKRNIGRVDGATTKVDCTCRMHFALANMVGSIHGYKTTLAGKCRPDDYRHDDLWLCMSAQNETGCPSYLIPARPEGWQIIEKNLDDGVERGVPSVSSVSTHVSDRTELINLFSGIGWRSLV
jgi:hypothetical protein